MIGPLWGGPTRLQGGRTTLFCTRTYNRLLRPGLAQIIPEIARDDSELRRGFDQLDEKIDRWIEREKVPAGNLTHSL